MNEAFRVASSGVSAMVAVLREDDDLFVVAVELPEEDFPVAVLELFLFRLALAFAISSCTALWMAASSSFRFCCFFFSSAWRFWDSFLSFSAF